MNNPFDITKAVDFTDEQIIEYWVDISSKGGFKDLLKPTSVMPMILLGSKGSGKTHLMRYFSYELQKIKYQENLKKGLEDDKFIGIYVRCSGFNSERFSNKGQSDEIWSSVYAYYWELWLAQITLSSIIDLQQKNIVEIPNEQELVEQIIGLLNKKPDDNAPLNLKDLVHFFSSLQRKVDYEVENCIFNEDNKLYIDILVSPARITYGLPVIMTELVPFFKDKIFLYLIDELENISENQQKLIQTLIREKNTSCTFRIGARLYGVRTYKTLGSGEENREGSEFEQVVLDEFLRSNNKNYADFMRRVCEHRLRRNGIYFSEEQKIDDFIESFNMESFFQKVKSKKPSQAQSYFSKLKEKLRGRMAEDEINSIIVNLSSDNVLIERTNVFLFYRAWNDLSKKKNQKEKKDLVQISLDIKEEALRYTPESKNEKNPQATVLNKFKRDIIDMLARETRENIPYYGFDDFLRMSSGTPRNLLNILKHSYKWTYFNEAKEAFRNKTKINLDAQTKGIKDTIDWFFEDNRIPAKKDGKLVDCIDRLGKFLRELKYSDIPPECSINIFGLNLESLSDEARRTFNFLENYSYIVQSEEDRRDKNSNNKYRTYNINGTIIPHWELSLSKRGIVILSTEEAESIFNLDQSDKFEELLRKRKKRYNAPFAQSSLSEQQPKTLFDL
ncbi:hypothetical protein [Chryseobacterium arthrosphaerae]|uniref:ORC-CDC6 family AAA ATPase n=1 Tax=Chryseobacterium arthrosphaerae TaxID=651561 RepID=UPI00241FAD8F|nr:hypothetical protein [Chryseobacterium arthrosphaerae]